MLVLSLLTLIYYLYTTLYSLIFLLRCAVYCLKGKGCSRLLLGYAIIGICLIDEIPGVSLESQSLCVRSLQHPKRL